MTAPAHRVGDLRDRPPAPGPAPMVDPPVVADLARGHPPGVQTDDHRVQSVHPPLALALPGAASSEPARSRGTTGLEGAHLASRWSWSWSRPRALAAGRGRRLPLLHGPGCSAGSARRPRPRNLLGAERGAAPGPRSSRACPESIRSNRPSRAPVSRNRRATSRPSTGPFPSSAALNRRQSLHQGSHKPLNTPPYAHG